MLQSLITEAINNGDGKQLYRLIVEKDVQKEIQKAAKLGAQYSKKTQAFLKVLNKYPSMKKASKEIGEWNGLMSKVFDAPEEINANNDQKPDAKDDATLNGFEKIVKYNTAVEVELDALKDGILIIGEWLNEHPAFSVGDKGIQLNDQFKVKYGKFLKNDITIADLGSGVEAFYKMVGTSNEEEWVNKYTGGDAEKLQEYKMEWPAEKAAWEELGNKAKDTFSEATEAAESQGAQLPDTVRPYLKNFKGYLTSLKKWLSRSDGPLSPKTIQKMIGNNPTTGLAGLQLNDFSEMIGNIIEVVTLVKDEKFDTLMNKVWTKAVKEEAAEEEAKPEEIQKSGLTEEFGDYFSDDGKATAQEKLKQLEGFIESYQRYLKNPIRKWEDNKPIHPDVLVKCAKANASLTEFISMFQFKNSEKVLFTEKELKAASQKLEQLGLKPPEKQKEVVKKNIPPTKLVNYMQSLKFDDNEIKWIGSKLQEMGMTLSESKKFSLISLLLEEVQVDDSIAYKLWELASEEAETEALADKIDANFDKLNTFFQNPDIEIEQNQTIPSATELPRFSWKQLQGNSKDAPKNWKKLGDVLGVSLDSTDLQQLQKTYRWSKQQTAMSPRNWFTNDDKKAKSIKNKEFIKLASKGKVNKDTEPTPDSKFILERWQRLAGILKD